MGQGYGAFFIFGGGLEKTAPLIAPITLVQRREEFHDEGNISF